MDLDWTLEAAGAVTLVRARLRNDRATDRRVRLRNCLDGLVLPPRRHGTPEAGWDREGVETVVPAGETMVLGYACPAPETEPPVVVDDVGAVQESESSDVSPDDAVRGLGDHRPPRDVLEIDHPERSGEATTVASLSPLERIHDPDSADRVSDSTAKPSDPPLPNNAEALLARYRTRIETAETLGAAGVPEATALLEANDGLAGIESLSDQLGQDTRELRAIAAAAATLADRAAAATPPTEALRRLS